MAVVGVLSTQLLHQQFIAERPTSAPAACRTMVDALTPLTSQG
jgi:hypothetical protein